MQGGTEHVARGVARTGQLAVGIAALDDHAAVVERVSHLDAGFFDGHALLLAQFAEQLGVFLSLGAVGGVDDRGTVDVAESPFLGQAVDFVDIAEQDKVGHAVGKNLVGSLEGAFFSSLRQYDALLVGFGASNELFNEFHCYNRFFGR